MNIAFLFNSDATEFNGFYGLPIMKKILDTGVLQQINRQMRISIGDLLTYRRCKNMEQLHAVYIPHSWDRRKVEELEATHNQATVFCWLFQNMTQEIAESLHNALVEDSSYLGGMDVSFSNFLHLYFFKNSLIESYRVHGRKSTLFYSMSENKDPDLAIKEIFEKEGFKVLFEDTGARNTICDNYNSLDHHQRISYFENIFVSRIGWQQDSASELTLNLEELHPYLFNILFAATRALERAEVKEELSQAYLSGRRFIEHLADFLYPSNKNNYLGNDGKFRNVKQDDYKNRIAAYIEVTLNKLNKFDKSEFEKLGAEMSNLYDSFCKGVHKPFSDEDDFETEKNQCNKIFSQFGRWLSKIIEIDPSSVRRPYLPYNKEMLNFFSKEMA